MTQKNLDLYLRDSLIKSFMIIFTTDKSSHLLLNPDLIEIAISCLQKSEDITLEAQRNVTRLVALVLRIPPVLQKILKINNSERILGGLPRIIE